MPNRYLLSFVVACLVGLATAAPAQQVTTGAISSYEDGVLVTSNDVTTCPYKVVGPVSANMRAHSWSLKELRNDPIAAKLRSNAKKLGADAVVLVTVGETHMTITALRSTPVTGRAVRYVDRACAPTS